MTLNSEYIKQTLKQDPGNSNSEFTLFIDTEGNFTSGMCNTGD